MPLTRSVLQAEIGQPPVAPLTLGSSGLTVWIGFGLLLASAGLPSGLLYLFALDSVIPGFAVLCALILLLAVTGFLGPVSAKKLINDGILAFLVMIAVTTHLAVASLFFPIAMGRSALAILLLGVAIITASQLSYFLMSMPREILSRVLILTTFSFILVAALAVAGLQPPTSLDRLKPIFPFTEPSHFALTFTPFLIDASVRAKSHRRLLWLAFAACAAILIQSLSLMVGALILAITCLKVREIAGLSVILILVMSLFTSEFDLSYFTDRLDFSRYSTNLSSLVYLQGWDLLRESLYRTSGFGIGFMQLGYVPTNVPTADVVYRLAGGDQNLYDGSFTAAKMISEFGVFGIIMVGVIIILMSSSVWKLRSKSILLEERRVEFMAYSFIVGLSIDFFVRGIGYFSGTSLLFLASLFILKRSRLRSKGEANVSSRLRTH